MRIELTVTAKGQVTLRQAVLDHLGIGPGDRVSVALRPDGRAELLPLRARPEIKSFRGILKRPDQRPVTIEEMQRAIEEGAEGPGPVRVAIDTNVLVRFLTEDDEAQAAAAARIMESASVVWVSTIVLTETTWVLRRAYKHTPTKIAAALRSFIDAQGVDVDEAAAEAGLRFLEQGGDFADGVIAHEAKQQRCDCLVTFDSQFARLSNGAATLLTGIE